MLRGWIFFISGIIDAVVIIAWVAYPAAIGPLTIHKVIVS
jgi:hypothetical protein